MNAVAPRIIRPQPGPQEMFLSTPADIAIFGGAAGGGKSYALLMEPIRHVGNKGFGGMVFRREATQITSPGGLWDTSRDLYYGLRGRPSTQPRHNWRFPSGASISMAHLKYDHDVQAWQGSQIPFLGWDELTHFSEYQFFYMLSRNRSASGVRPYVRATCNPDAGSWVAKLIEWWIDQETGYAIPERSGVIRYFMRLGDEMVWGASPAEVIARAGNRVTEEMARMGVTSRDLVKSLTFIVSKLEDNPALLSRDPTYWANLMALPRVERERLLGGNWKIRAAAGLVFPANRARIIPAVPGDVRRWVRRWDLAATKPSETNKDPDATAGVLMGEMESGLRWVVADVEHIRDEAHEVRKLIKATAEADRRKYGRVTTVLPKDPAQAGKDQAATLVAMLKGFHAVARPESGDKLTRAEPFSAQWQAGNVDLVEGRWNVPFIAELDGFAGLSKDKDDQVDAASGAFAYLNSGEPYYDASLGWV